MTTSIRVRPEREAPQPPNPGSRATAGALVGVVVAGAVLPLWGLGANGRVYDGASPAMGGRLPLGSLFGSLRAPDSPPPLDSLLPLPLARLGVDPFWFRLPGALCSVAALS